MARGAVILLLSCAALHAELSYRSRIQITGGQLYNAMGASGPHARDAVIATRLIKGYRMAVLERKLTTVIDLEAETVTTIDYAKKTYAVTPLAEMKQRLEDAEARAPHEDGFTAAPEPATATAPVGLINASQIAFRLLGSGGKFNVTADSWIAIVPGYEQMTDWIERLAAKMGNRSAYVFASGLAELALRTPESVQGFNEALERLNQAQGAPLQTEISISGPDGSVAQASIELSNFGGGVQDAAKFSPPANFKKVEAAAAPAP